MTENRNMECLGVWVFGPYSWRSSIKLIERNAFYAMQSLFILLFFESKMAEECGWTRENIIFDEITLGISQQKMQTSSYGTIWTTLMRILNAAFEFVSNGWNRWTTNASTDDFQCTKLIVLHQAPAEKKKHIRGTTHTTNTQERKSNRRESTEIHENRKIGGKMGR